MRPAPAGRFLCAKVIVKGRSRAYTVGMTIPVNSPITILAVTAFVAVFIVLLGPILSRVAGGMM